MSKLDDRKALPRINSHILTGRGGDFQDVERGQNSISLFKIHYLSLFKFHCGFHFMKYPHFHNDLYRKQPKQTPWGVWDHLTNRWDHWREIPDVTLKELTCTQLLNRWHWVSLHHVFWESSLMLPADTACDTASRLLLFLSPSIIWWKDHNIYYEHMEHF